MKTHYLTRAFIEAAEMVDEGREEFSCVALRAALPSEEECCQIPEVQFYLSSVLAHGETTARLSQTFINELPGGGFKPDLNRSFRVLLLLFMAVAWKDMPGAEEFK